MFKIPRGKPKAPAPAPPETPRHPPWIEQQSRRIRSAHPEIHHWSDLSVELAWSDFSWTIHSRGWREPPESGRDVEFLLFCCWRIAKGLHAKTDYEKFLKLRSQWISH